MSDKREFTFGGGSVVDGYDSVLVPVLFHPWAIDLIEHNNPWEGKTVVDLAAGTGVVSEQLPSAVGVSGKVYAVDISEDMLALARKRCQGLTPEVNFLVCGADKIELADASVDRIVCQQGFQFFPDKEHCLNEMYRVLKPGGDVILSTWCEVEKCELFGAICEALEQLGLDDISAMMRMPFDHMPKEELMRLFENSNFVNTDVFEESKDLFLAGGLDYAVVMAYATPIGPKLNELDDSVQEKFKAKLKAIVKKYQDNDTSMGLMVSNVVVAYKE